MSIETITEYIDPQLFIVVPDALGYRYGSETQ